MTGKNVRILALVITCCLTLSAVATCSLNVSSDCVQRKIADKFTASNNYPIQEIEFYGSWKGDQKGQISTVQASIFENVNNCPGRVLWNQTFYNISELFSDVGLMDWNDPYLRCPPIINDHEKIWQYNICDIVNPFEPVQGVDYWFSLSVRSDNRQYQFGWNTDTETSYTMLFCPSVNQWYQIDPANQISPKYYLTPDIATAVTMCLGFFFKRLYVSRKF